MEYLTGTPRKSGKKDVTLNMKFDKLDGKNLKKKLRRIKRGLIILKSFRPDITCTFYAYKECEYANNIVTME